MRFFVGHLYVLRFSNGEVKIGRTEHLTSRLRQHRDGARGRGLTVTDQWVSEPHIEFDINEEALKEVALKLGGTPVGTSREYFTGVDWAEMVTVAKRLPRTSPEEVQPRTGAERRAGLIGDREEAVRKAALDAWERETGAQIGAIEAAFKRRAAA